MHHSHEISMEVFAIHNDKKLESVTFQRLFNILSVEERQRNERFLQWQDAQRNLLGRIAIRNMIFKRFSIGMGEIELSEDRYGKPYCKHVEGFHFNISHSGEWIVAVGSNSPVGIDVEKISQIELGIAEQFFSVSEYEELKMMSLKQRTGCFFDLWTLKESCIKADGRGFSVPSKSFTIIRSKDEIHVVGALERYFFKQYDIDQRYKLSVCSLANAFPDTVRVIGIEEFTADIFNQLCPSEWREIELN